MKDLKKLSKKIYDLQCEIEEKQLEQNKLKEELIASINAVGERTYKDEYWTLYFSEDTKNVKFDEKMFKLKDFKLYNKLLGKYNKISSHKGGYSWKKVK